MIGFSDNEIREAFVEMTPRERLLATVAFEPVDRPFRMETPMLEARGYIPSIDHAVPPEVSLENWNYFLEVVRDTGERFCE